MPVKLLYLGLLLGLVSYCWAKEQQCLKSIYACDECIQSGPECAWCTAPDSKIRCHTLNGLERAGCLPEHVYNPQGGVQIARNDSSTESVNSKSLFLQPQELSVQLRPGVRQSFPLTITMATDQPIRELIMDTSHVPVGVNITFSYILQRNPMVVEVHVEASRCLSEKDDSNQMHNRTGPWSVFITPRGFSQSVKLEITVECQCACTGNRQENSHACSGQGALVCGKCRCYEPYIGQQCEWNLESTDIENEDGCRSGPNAPVCSTRGACIFGLCECNIRENPEEKYSGRYCECSNFNCPFWNNRMCGGHGKCECGRCICDDGWTDEDCSCSMETASCMTRNHMLCNGKGICQCGRCKCEKPYGGLTCEVCPTCPGLCQEYSKCVECRAFGTGAKGEWCDRQCSHLTVEMVETKQDLTGDLCKMRSHDNFCFFYFSYSSTPSGLQFTVLRFQQCHHK